MLVVVFVAVESAADDDTVDIAWESVVIVSGDVMGNGTILSGLMLPAELTTTGNGSVCEVGERIVGGVCHP